MRALLVAALIALGPSIARADTVAPPQTVVVDHGAGARLTAKVLVVGTVALWTVSTVIAQRTKNQYDSFEIDRDEAKLRIGIASGMFITGAFALGAAAIFYFGPGRKREVRTAVAPVVTPDRVGLALARRF